jgi:hypothetical protein
MKSSAAAGLAFCLLLPCALAADDNPKSEWKFAVSGDSRNCGDVVMPEIARGALDHGAAFYWHLGDFRAIVSVDEDLLHQAAYDPDRGGHGLNNAAYYAFAWPDFIEHQIKPFGSLPVFLAIGNHETVPPKNREEYTQQFYAWLNALPLARQRAIDYKWDARVRTYYRWVHSGVDFITLDNGSGEQFDAAQLAWFETVLAWDAEDPSIHTVVVGMHKALPYSQSFKHSMNETLAGTESGVRVYEDLLKVRDGKFIDDSSIEQTRKRVYLLASHSHYYLRDLYRTKHWEDYGQQHYGNAADGVIEGYIVGTAGAVRYEPPPAAVAAGTALRHTYGYLLATVQPDGQIAFTFEKVERKDVVPAVQKEYTPQFIDWCFNDNPAPAQP